MFVVYHCNLKMELDLSAFVVGRKLLKICNYMYSKVLNPNCFISSVCSPRPPLSVIDLSIIERTLSSLGRSQPGTPSACQLLVRLSSNEGLVPQLIRGHLRQVE
jgi:hypothetical protein